MMESRASTAESDRTVGGLRTFILLTISVIPMTVTVAMFLYAVISGHLSEIVVILTNLFLITYPLIWGMSGADETSLMQTFFRNRDLPPVYQQFVRVLSGVAVGFGIILGLAMIGMIAVFVAPNTVLTLLGMSHAVEPYDAWFYLFLVFLVYTAVDILSWLTRRWFLRHLISGSQSLSDYYLGRRHVRRLVAQCVCPALFLCLAVFSWRIDSVSSVLACSVFLASTTYSEAVVASWRTQMKRDLKLESEGLMGTLDRMIARDRLWKIALYGWFLLASALIVMWSVSAIIQHFSDTVKLMYWLGAKYPIGDRTFGWLGPFVLAIVVGIVAFLFKLQSQFFYGFVEAVVGMVFIWYAIPNPLPPNGLDIVKIIGSIFVLIRGLENSRSALPRLRVDLAATIENFGRLSWLQ
jgi:hypothetical protein